MCRPTSWATSPCSKRPWRLEPLEHVVYASSSSVYGGNAKLPFSRRRTAWTTPVSLYAATKRADELMSARLLRICTACHCTGLRFFTVYGPWGRPDMALFEFTAGDHGRRRRSRSSTTAGCGATSPTSTTSSTGVLACLDRPPPDGAAPLLFNIGNNRAEDVSDLVGLLESSLGRRALIRDVPRPVSDVAETWADLTAIEAYAGYRPRTPFYRGRSALRGVVPRLQAERARVAA